MNWNSATKDNLKASTDAARVDGNLIPAILECCLALHLMESRGLNMSKDFVAGDDYEPDPVFVNSWRETIVIISLFVFFMVWTVGVSFALGFEDNYLPKPGGKISLVWGMPSWVFYGVFLPWMVVNVIAVWFCFGFMKNDDLGADETVDPVPPDSGEKT